MAGKGNGQVGGGLRALSMRNDRGVLHLEKSIREQAGCEVVVGSNRAAGLKLAKNCNVDLGQSEGCVSEASHSRVGRVMTHFALARILIVDDSPGWRARVREILAAHPEWEIISEAADGQEAVREARELQPDIVVLDIGMPRLNGIEAAKMIRQKSPKSRIVFLTVNNDSEVVKAALDVGQTAYVPKANAATQLCEAVAASLRET